VARRYRQLSEEISELAEQLDRLVAETAPELVAVRGLGTDTAASLMIAAGDNPECLKSEAAFAHLCGVAPIPASSGKTVRHRLNLRDVSRAPDFGQQLESCCLLTGTLPPRGRRSAPAAMVISYLDTPQVGLVATNFSAASLGSGFEK
jgi:Transposase IS116/IS110/IS902 family